MVNKKFQEIAARIVRENPEMFKALGRDDEFPALKKTKKIAR